MKILHLCICGPFIPNGGYQENLLTKYQKKLGHEIVILTSVSNGYNTDGSIKWTEPGISFLDNGIKLIRVPLMIQNSFIFSHLHWHKSIYDFIVQEKPDYIFGHDICSFNYLCLVKYRKENPKVKIVFDNHTDYYNSASTWLSKNILHKIIWKSVAQQIDSIVDKYYGVTPVRCDFLNEVYGIDKSKIGLLLMGSDDDYMQIENRSVLRQKIRLQYNVAPNDFLIVTGGKIDDKKNIHILLKAICESNIPNVKVIIFGSIHPELKTTIDSFLSDNIIYIGWINSTDVYQYFYAADLAAFPGGHSVLWEQVCASRTPALFSMKDGMQHISYGNCILLQENNVPYYINILREIISEKKKYLILKRNAEGEMSNKFLYSSIAKTTIDDYCNM